MSGSVSLADVVEAGVESGLARVELLVPCRVEEYDGKAKVRVAPLLRELVSDGEGGEVTQDLPVVDDVTVEWPGGGGARLTFPIEVGDTGVLVFSGRSLDEWKAAPNRVVTPADNRRHAFMDAVFRPGLKSPAAPWTGVRTDAVTLGYDGPDGMQVHITPAGIALGAASPGNSVAKGEALNSAISTLATAIATALTTMGGGPAGAAAPVLGAAAAAAGTAIATAVASFNTSAAAALSTTVKVKG